MTTGQCVDNASNVVGNDAPTDPALETRPAMIETAIEATGTAQLADPAFDATPETLGGAEPALVFEAATARGRATGLGQTDVTHTQGPRLLFVGWREETAIAAQQAGDGVEMAVEREKPGLVVQTDLGDQQIHRGNRDSL